MTAVHRFPTSGFQEQFVHTTRAGSSTANLAIALRFEGPFDPDALQCAVQRLAVRHEALRTTLHAGDPPEQHVAATARLAIRQVAPPAAPAGGDPLVELLAQECGRAFRLLEEPLVRVVLMRVAREHHGVVLTLHHAMADGWSMRILARDLTRLYRACRANVDPGLPPVELGPGDLATWERTTAHAGAEHWRRSLADLDPAGSIGPPLPVGLRPTHVFRSTTLASAATCRGLEALAAERGTSTSTVLMAAFAAALSTWSAETVVLGDIRANRELPGLHATVGLVADLTPVRIELGGDPTFGALLERVHAAAAEARRHRMPFGAIHRAVGNRGPWHARRLFDATFNFRPLSAPAGASEPECAEGSPRISEVTLPLERHVWSLERELLMPVDFGLDVELGARGLEGQVACDPQWLDDASRRALERALTAVLARAPTEADVRIGRLCAEAGPASLPRFTRPTFSDSL
jgi:hypothetical protein